MPKKKNTIKLHCNRCMEYNEHKWVINKSLSRGGEYRCPICDHVYIQR